MKNLILASDVGGTKIYTGLVNTKNKVITKEKSLTQSNRGERQVVKNILASLHKNYDKKKVKAIGIGIAGITDLKGEKFISGPNLPLKNINLKKIIEKEFKIPVNIENDANCFTLAEAITGAGKKYNDVVGVTLGTGIGGGIVINKKLYRGANGTAGEFGHMKISDEKVKCSCGQFGHFEILAAGTAMIKLFQKLTGKKENTFVIEEKAIAGDKKALEVCRIMTEHLSTGIANIINVLNPDVIVIGGGMARVKLLWPEIKKQTKNKILNNNVQSTIIVKSPLDDDAGIIGAALITNRKYI